MSETGQDCYCGKPNNQAVVFVHLKQSIDRFNKHICIIKHFRRIQQRTFVFNCDGG